MRKEKKFNLTQEKLAEQVEISEAYVGQIERGERILSLDTLVKLANQLGVTVDHLLSESVNLNDDSFVIEIRQILMNRSNKERRMALEVLKVILSHLDDMDSQ